MYIQTKFIYHSGIIKVIVCCRLWVWCASIGLYNDISVDLSDLFTHSYSHLFIFSRVISLAAIIKLFCQLFGYSANNTPWILMKYLNCLSLFHWIKRLNFKWKYTTICCPHDDSKFKTYQMTSYKMAEEMRRNLTIFLSFNLLNHHWFR